MRTPLVLGNWKQNGDLASVVALAEAVSSPAGVDVGVCPMSVHLSVVAPFLSDGVALGAQDVSEYQSGAYTGQVGAAVLSELGCQFVLVGHSERRALCAETSAAVGRKAKMALGCGLTPVVCIGETLDQRESGVTNAVVSEQLEGLFAVLGAGELARCVVAYEPVWAIGTGKSATAEQAQEVHAFIRSLLEQAEAGAGSAVKILYGGSVKSENAAVIFAKPDVDGGLIGGASLDAEAFGAIISAAVRSGE